MAAPYIKLNVLKQFTFPPIATKKTTFVCRWNLEDVVSGATDVEVYPWLRDRGIRVLLHKTLHAKFYRVDETVLLGSANISSNGLIDDDFGSLEILTRINSDAQTRAFEDKLTQESIVITDQIYLDYLSVIPQKQQIQKGKHIEFFWPSYSTFEQIWSEYSSGKSHEDLQQLEIPLGLNEAGARNYLRIRLREFVNIRRVEKFICSDAEGRRFGEVRALIRNLDDSINETLSWQSLMPLLLDLYPEKYEYFRPNHTEIIIAKS